MLTIAEAIVLGAVNRQESRGSHYRTDFPKRDDELWQRHTLISRDGTGLSIGYRVVSVTRFKPEERKY